jgi:uncharacterized ion transporter superfamily protein YfcC
MEHLGGRKFIAFLVAFAFVYLVFTVMLIKHWLDARVCMEFLTYVPIILGVFVAGNTVGKFVKKKEGENKANEKVNIGSIGAGDN